MAVLAVGAILTRYLLPLLPIFADCSPEAQPKYIKGNKRYGRRSLPEFQQSVEDFAEVTVLEPLGEEVQPPHITTSSREQVSGVAVGHGDTVLRAACLPGQQFSAGCEPRSVPDLMWAGGEQAKGARPHPLESLPWP